MEKYKKYNSLVRTVKASKEINYLINFFREHNKTIILKIPKVMEFRSYVEECIHESV